MKPIGEDLKKALQPRVTPSEKLTKPQIENFSQALKCLTQVANFYRRDLTAEDKKLWLAELLTYDHQEIAEALKRYMAGPQSQFFPMPGQVLELIATMREEKRLNQNHGRHRITAEEKARYEAEEEKPESEALRKKWKATVAKIAGKTEQSA
jgi:hypothetical protein